MKKKIRFDYVYFWPKFKSEGLITRFPILSTKYEFIYDPIKPDYLFFSAFDGSMGERTTMPTPPDIGVPTIFLTAENVKPDLSRCDYAISFSYDLDSTRHIRIPNWVQRLNSVGINLESLLNTREMNFAERTKFCAYVYRNKVPLRESVFLSVSKYKSVDSPSLSQNNVPAIGPSVIDKINFLRDYKFSFAFENESSVGYTTEKLIESLISGSIPLYWGDPLVGNDFNCDAFINYDDYKNADDFVNMIVDIDNSSSLYRKIINTHIFKNNKIPDCANNDIIFNFFENIFG